MVLAGALFLVLRDPRSGPPSKLYWGANTIGYQFTKTTQPPFDWTPVTDFARADASNKMPSVIGWGEPFHSETFCNAKGYPSEFDCPFQRPQFDTVRQHGVIPMLDWSSANEGHGTDPNFTDAAVAHGSQDGYITAFAREVKAWGHPLFLRFDWEMNSNLFNWGVNYNHDGDTPAVNSPAEFVAMWRHVHDIFTRVGATNVTWVWCPNIGTDNTVPLNSVYPGDDYVDWTCLDGYNGADPKWTSFADLFRSSYDQIAGSIASSKPMIIGETATTEAGGSKAQWITDMLNSRSFPKIAGILWFDRDEAGPGGRTDWPIESSKASQAAFAAGIQNPRYMTNSYSQLDTSPIPPPG